MGTGVSEKSRVRTVSAEVPAPRGRPGPAVRRLRGIPIALVLPMVIAAAASFAFLRWTRPVPLSIHEHALLTSRDALPRAARMLPDLIGSDGNAWRALGAAAVGLNAFAIAVLASRLSKRTWVPAVASAVVATHAAAWSAAASVAGTLTLLALASAACAAWTLGRSLRRVVEAAACGALAALLLPWPIPELPWWDALLLACNRAPGAPPGSIAVSAAALALAAGASTLFASRRSAAPLACAAAAACAILGAGGSARHLSVSAGLHAEEQRFLARLDATPPLEGAGAAEVVLDAPASDEDLAGARPARRCARTPAFAETADVVRIVQWTAPEPEGLLSSLPKELSPIIEGAVDPSIVLLSPEPGASLPARTAADEPEFRFVTDDAGRDPSTLCVVVIADLGDRARVVVRRLEAGIIRREEASDPRVVAWRPAWRPMRCAERELRWEDGDVCPRGGVFWWTVAVTDEDGVRIAPLRRATVSR